MKEEPCPRFREESGSLRRDFKTPVFGVPDRARPCSSLIQLLIDQPSSAAAATEDKPSRLTGTPGGASRSHALHS